MTDNFDPTNPEMNPLKGAKFPSGLMPEDIIGAQTAPDVPADVIPVTSGALLIKKMFEGVEFRAELGAINDYALSYINEIESDPLISELPHEAISALDFLHSVVEYSASNNEPDVIMSLTNQLEASEGDMHEEALDYTAGDELDQERYMRVLEHLAKSIEKISIWQMSIAKGISVPSTLHDSLSQSLADMQCYELLIIVDRHFRPRGRQA